jgi:hypothetical protein
MESQMNAILPFREAFYANILASLSKIGAAGEFIIFFT